MNLDWYYTFLILAKELNYRKASRILFLTEPSLHQQIKKLENHLKLKLFESKGKRLFLTEMGKEFEPLAQNIINTYEENIKKIQLKNNKNYEYLNIGVSSYIAIYLMPKFLPLFLKEEPKIKISLSVYENVISNFENNNMDIGITREKPLNNMNYEMVCEGKISLVISKNSETNEEQLYKNYNILCDNHPLYWEKLKKDIYDFEPEANFISVKDVYLTKKLIELNQGISFLPKYIIDKNNQNLKEFTPKRIELPVSFTYLIRKKESEAINKFIKLFKKFIEKEQKKQNKN